jgi:hypothetical protein
MLVCLFPVAAVPAVFPKSGITSRSETHPPTLTHTQHPSHRRRRRQLLHPHEGKHGRRSVILPPPLPAAPMRAERMQAGDAPEAEASFTIQGPYAVLLSHPHHTPKDSAGRDCLFPPPPPPPPHTASLATWALRPSPASRWAPACDGAGGPGAPRRGGRMKRASGGDGHALISPAHLVPRCIFQTPPMDSNIVHSLAGRGSGDAVTAAAAADLSCCSPCLGMCSYAMHMHCSRGQCI